MKSTASSPAAVRPVRRSGSVVDGAAIRDVYAYTLVSLVCFIGATVLVALDASRMGVAVNVFEAMGAAASTFFNIGPAFGLTGPFANYSGFPETTTVVTTLLMWIARIEIIPVSVLLTLSDWLR